MHVQNLEDPDFVAWLKTTHPGEIVPDAEYLSPTVSPKTSAEKDHQYRLAQSRKLIRLYDSWEAGRKKK
jgi:hypothetical protein